MKEFKGKIYVLLLCLITLISCTAPRKCWQLNFRNYSNQMINVKVAIEDSTQLIDYGRIAAGDSMKINCLTSDSFRGEVIVSVNKNDSTETKAYTIQELRSKAMTVIYKSQLP